MVVLNDECAPLCYIKLIVKQKCHYTCNFSAPFTTFDQLPLIQDYIHYYL